MGENILTKYNYFYYDEFVQIFQTILSAYKLNNDQSLLKFLVKELSQQIENGISNKSLDRIIQDILLINVNSGFNNNTWNNSQWVLNRQLTLNKDIIDKFLRGKCSRFDKVKIL